jgi:hypothetical protein
MTASFLLALLLIGNYDVGLQIGGVAPLGDLEANHKTGISGSVVLGRNAGPHRWELGIEGLELAGNQQPGYALTDYRLALAYHYALVNKLDWQLRAGLGIDWHNLTRRLNQVSERGSVPGATLTFSYARNFGHPKFLFQLYGSELLEFGRQGDVSTVQSATLVGFRMGVGYEF